MIQSAGNCIGAGGREGEEEQTFSASPHCRVLGIITLQALYTPYMPPPGSEMGIPDAVSASGCNGDRGPVVFYGDEQFLTYPGLGCSGEGAGSIPTTRSSYILGHIPLPPWPPTPGMAGATSLPHRVIHSFSLLPPQHWWSGLKPVCPPPPYLGGFCSPQAGSCGSLTPHPQIPLGGCVRGSQPAWLSAPS